MGTINKPYHGYIQAKLYWYSRPESDLYRDELERTLIAWGVTDDRIAHARRLRESRDIVSSVNLFHYDNAQDYMIAVVQRAKDLNRPDLLEFLEKPNN